MIETIFKKLHIKTNPNKVISFTLYAISFFVVFICLGKLLKFFIASPTINNDVPGYMYAIWFFVIVLAYSYLMNAGVLKNDRSKKNAYVFSFGILSIMVLAMVETWITNLIWWGLKLLPNFEAVYNNTAYREFFSPAIRTIAVAIPFVALFRVIDYFIHIYNVSKDDEDLGKAIAGFSGIDARKTVKEDVVFNCSNIICTQKGTNIPVIVPEKKRYEATLVQGATGTGKTATILLPMSARDLEKKFFFREYSKKLGYSMLKRGIAYVSGPYDNEYLNNNFTLNFLKPRKGNENTFYEQVKKIVQYKDNSTGEITYKNLGITIVENDGKFISDFIGVANNFSVPVLSVDPGNPETTLSINPFAIEDPSKVASIIADVLKSMYEDQGGGGAGDPFFTQVTLDAFQNLAILLKEMHPILNNGEVASLEDMLEMLYNFDKVEEMTEEMKKHAELEQKYKLLIAYFEKNFYKPSLNINGYEIPGTRGSGRKETEKYLYGAITQLNNLLRNPGLKKALCGKSNILNFDDALSTGKVITACSRKGELGIIQSKAFGMFFIMQFQDAVLRRKGNEDSRTPHFLYIDEFPEYINKDMDVMFTLFRKYRCGITIAIQNLSQLEKSGKGYYRQTVLANTKTQIIFGDTVPEDSEYWQQAFGKEKLPDADSSFSYDANNQEVKKRSLQIKEKEKAKAWKIQALGFGSVYYKTKDIKGTTVFGQGKANFLESKYKEKKDTLNFNFEKYMMNKPSSASTITFNNDSDEDSDEDLFGVSTTSKLMDELKKAQDDGAKFVNKVSIAKKSNEQSSDLNSNISSNSSNNSSSDDKVVSKYSATTTVRPENTGDIEIEFEDIEPTLDTGVINETYESPVIKRKK